MIMKTTELVSQNGGPVIFDKATMGFNPADILSACQVHCTGLDGGTYSVSILPPEGYDFISYQDSATQTDGVLVTEQSFIFQALKVTFMDLGANAEPKVKANFFRRRM